jgi:hypothetical protein
VALALYEFTTAYAKLWPAGLDGIETRRYPDLYTAYGYGTCGELSFGLASLWKVAGFEARIWCSGHHMISEVCWDKACDPDRGAWHMFDPYFAVYFRNPEKGQILGVKEIAEKGEKGLKEMKRVGKSLKKRKQDKLIRACLAADKLCTEDLSIQGPTPYFTLAPGASMALHPDGYNTFVCKECTKPPSQVGTGIVQIPFKDRMDWKSAYPVDRAFVDLKKVRLLDRQMGHIEIHLSLKGTSEDIVRFWEGVQRIDVSSDTEHVFLDLSSAFDDRELGIVTEMNLTLGLEGLSAETSARIFFQFSPRLVQLKGKNPVLEVLGNAEEVKLEVEVEK